MAAIMTYNNTVYPCSVDIDCPGVSVCYFFNKTNPNQGYCSCDVGQGAKGLLCDQLSPVGYGRVVTHSLNLAFAVIVVLAICYQIFLMSKVKRVNLFDARITSLIMLGISLTFYSIYISIGLYWILHPILPFEEDKVTGKKRKPLSQLRIASLTFNSFFFITSSLNVSIFWLEVAIASRKFKRIIKPQLSKNYRYAVFVLDFIIALVIGLANWFALAYASIVGVLLFSIVLILYIYSAYEITKEMNQKFQESRIESSNQISNMKNINQSLLLIKKFAIQYVVLMVLWIIFLVLGTTQFQGLFKRLWKEDEVPYLMLFFEIAYFFAVGAGLAILKYIHDSSIKPTSSKSKNPINNENHVTKSVTGLSGGVVVPSLKSDQASPQ